MDPKVRRGIAKEGRLWLLAVLCAIPGALASQHYGSWWAGFGFFAVTFAILGPMLWVYEKRKRARLADAHPVAGQPASRRSSSHQSPPSAGGRGARNRPSVSQRYGQRKRPPKNPS